MIEKYRDYAFEIYCAPNRPTHWTYKIYTIHYKSRKQMTLIESDEKFDSEAEARMAAIGHIHLIEKGEV
jgi:hypothetical protein